jgi:hypothetical protein
MTVENKKLKLVYWTLDQIKPYEKNPRKNDAVLGKMVKSIQEYGFTVPILAKSDGSVIDGHLRLKAAFELGLEQIPVVLTDHLTKKQVKAFRLMANQSANWAKWDMDQLYKEISDLKLDDFDLTLTGFDANFLKDMEVIATLDARELGVLGEPTIFESTAGSADASSTANNSDLRQACRQGADQTDEEEADFYDDVDGDDDDENPADFDEPSKAKRPLSIVLNVKDFATWLAYKKSVDCPSDQAAFLKLLKAVQRSK